PLAAWPVWPPFSPEPTATAMDINCDRPPGRRRRWLRAKRGIMLWHARLVIKRRDLDVHFEVFVTAVAKAGELDEPGASGFIIAFAEGQGQLRGGAAQLHGSGKPGRFALVVRRTQHEQVGRLGD